ncbi:MAG: hypothetical protein AB1646_25315 [Thermodesulfobacteriota bacterium]
MRPSQITKIRSGLERAINLVAGDPVIHVAANGIETDLVTLQYDVPGEGLGITNAGLLKRGVRELVFLTSALAAANVEITPTSHFLIRGERWDLVEDSPISEATVPLAGIQNIVTVRVRRASEREASETAAEVIWQP